MASKYAKLDISSEPRRYNNEEIRIVVVGKTGAGKSSSGNTILGYQHFKSEFSPDSLTTVCAKAYGEMEGQKVAVIDTPGLFDTRTDEKKTIRDISQCVSFASPGPHIFLVVIKLGRFTKEEKQTVQKIQKIFGKEADKYSMVLFTHGDLLKDEPIEKFLEKSKELQELVERCNGQYHVFNNDPKDCSQVSELLDKIRKITEKNGGSHYTTDMFQKAERIIEEEKQRILKKKEEKMNKEREELEKKLQEEFEQKMKEEKANMEKEKELRAASERKKEKEIKKLKDDYEKKELEQKMKEEKANMEKEKELRAAFERKKEEEIKKLKDDYEKKELEQKMKEEKANMEKEKELRTAFERKKEEEIKKLKDDYEERARREAERSESVIFSLGTLVAAAIGGVVGAVVVAGAAVTVGVGLGVGAAVVGGCALVGAAGYVAVKKISASSEK